MRDRVDTCDALQVVTLEAYFLRHRISSLPLCEHTAAVWLAKRCDVATDDIRPDSESTSVQVNGQGFSVRLHTDKQHQHLLRSRGV